MDSISQIQDWRKEAKDLYERQRAFTIEVNTGDEGWTSENQEEFDKRVADFKSVQAKIDNAEKLAEGRTFLDRLSDSQGVAADDGDDPTQGPDPEKRVVDFGDATMRFMMNGPQALHKDERQALGFGKSEDGVSITIPFAQLRALVEEEKRAQSVGTATAGQEFVPEGFWPSLTEALQDFGGMAEAARIITTPTGNDLPFPTFDDTSNTGALLAENSADSEQDVTTGETVLNAYKYTSKITKVSKELEQDSFFAVAPWIGSVHGTRLARIRNTHATTGTGSSQPNGAVTAASDSTVTTTNGTTFATRANILDLIGSIDPAYRRGPRVRHMFSDDSLIRVMKMEDANNLPLYNLSTRVGAPATIEGYPFTVNQDIADLASTAKFWIFGDFNYYIIRMVLGITLVRLVERYADAHQIGYVALMRFDSDLVDGGGGAIKWMDAGV